MGIPSTGQIGLSTVVNEYGGTAPHKLSEYYGAGPGVPVSGALRLSDFRGKSAEFLLLVPNSVANPDLWQMAKNDGWNGTHKLIVNFTCPYVNTIKLPYAAGKTFPGGLRLVFAQSTFVGGVKNSGHAITTTIPVSIYHPGTIAGGGGPGGKGSDAWYQWKSTDPVVWSSGEAGGSGQGFSSLSSLALESAKAGQAAPLMTYSGDIIGGQVASQAQGGTGGTGGSWGQPGNTGGYSYTRKGDGYRVSDPDAGSPGSAAGCYIVGNSNVTWEVAGTRLGRVA